MAVVIKPKRGTNTPGTDDIVSGEIAIDTSAKKLYINDGGTVKEIGGGGGTTTNITGEAGMSRYQYVATNGQTTFTGSDANGNTLSYPAGGLLVFLNGVYLQGYNNVDYTATNETSVVLTNGAATSDVIDIVAVKGSTAGRSGMNRFQYVATNGQTTFTGADANSKTLTYVANNLMVFLNGIYLQGYNNVDYTASSGTSVVLVNGAATSDVIDIIAISTTYGSFDDATTADVSSTATALAIALG